MTPDQIFDTLNNLEQAVSELEGMEPDEQQKLLSEVFDEAGESELYCLDWFHGLGNRLRLIVKPFWNAAREKELKELEQD